MLDDVLFIVNPVSGRKLRKPFIMSRLKASGGRIVVTEHPGQAETIAREAPESIVVAVGGDGTVNEVARGLLGTDKVMGIIPCGSGDGLALDLGISRHVDKALKVIEKGQTRTIDSARIDGQPFFSTCGVGLDALVSQKFADSDRRGLVTYIHEAIAAWRHFKPEEYNIEIDGQTVECKSAIVSVGNSKQWGNGAQIAPKAVLDDGELDVTVIDMFSTLEIPLLVLRLMTGRLNSSDKVHHYIGKDIVISRKSDGPAHFDGDYKPEGKDIHVAVLPASLKVLAP